MNAPSNGAFSLFCANVTGIESKDCGADLSAIHGR